MKKKILHDSQFGDREADCPNDDANCQTGMECENKRCAPESIYGERYYLLR